MEKFVRSRDEELVGKGMQYLKRDTLDIQKQNLEMAAKESSWEEEKMRILKALRSERLLRKEAQKELKEQDRQNPVLQNQLLQTTSNQLKDSHQHNTQLAAEIAALKQHMAAKESCWDVEKNKIMMAQRATKIQAQIDLQNLEQKKQKVIDLLRQNLLEKQSKILMVRQTPSIQPEDSPQVTDLAAENTALKQQMAAKESSWEEEKMRILKALRSERLIRKEAQKELKEQDRQNPDLQVQLLQTPSIQLENSPQVTELAAELAALKQQMATKESCWEEEKTKILNALRSERLIRKEAQKELKEQDRQNPVLQDQLPQSPSNQQKDSNQHNTELAGELASLKQQIADKESCWELMKNTITMALVQAQMDLQTMELEKEKVIDSSSQSLLEKENEIVMVKQHWVEKCEKACEAWDEKNRETRETFERELQYAVDQHNLIVKSLQDESDRKVSQVILEKDDLITQMTTAKVALEAEWTTKLAALQDQSLKSEVQLKEKEMQLLQSEAEWTTKLAALQDQSLESEVQLKEKEMQLLQSEAEWTTKLAALQDQSLESEVQLKEKEMQLFQSQVQVKEKEMQLFQSETESSTKLAALEDQIRIRTDTTTDLQAQVLRLQELNQTLDLGALKMTAEEMSAKKKELKKLIVEKEKEEKREKKEREEREKREKKEREEREKEELRREKKEKEAREKQEKVDFKREKKERKERERREK